MHASKFRCHGAQNCRESEAFESHAQLSSVKVQLQEVGIPQETMIPKPVFFRRHARFVLARRHVSNRWHWRACEVVEMSDGRYTRD